VKGRRPERRAADQVQMVQNGRQLAPSAAKLKPSAFHTHIHGLTTLLIPRVPGSHVFERVMRLTQGQMFERVWLNTGTRV
jgi:hypothetical protein